MMDPSITERPVHPALWAITGAMAALELLFMASDAGALGQVDLRTAAYRLFGFWDSAFETAIEGRVSLQLLWSFATHAMLHGGLLHLLMNGAAFLGIGHMISGYVGMRATLVIMLSTAAAGALVYGLIGNFWGPMVGASGVVFGFLGVITAWQERALRLRGLDRRPIWARIAGLVAINAVLMVGFGGMLAWEAHLGGFIAGWLLAYAYPPRRPRVQAPAHRAGSRRRSP